MKVGVKERGEIRESETKMKGERKPGMETDVTATKPF